MYLRFIIINKRRIVFMPKSNIDTNTIFKREPYKSIINLIRSYQMRYDQENNILVDGLTHGQILYALMKNPPDNNEHKDFFDNTFFWHRLHDEPLKLEDLYKIRITPREKLPPHVKKGSIKTPQQLNEKLNLLFSF
jgi:hypothetical protein